MVDLQERTGSFQSHFDAVASSFSGDLDARRTALAAFEAVSWPTTRDEEFRFTSLRELIETPLGIAPKATLSADEFAQLPIAKLEGPRLVFVNGHFDATLSNSDNIPGLTIGRLAEDGAANLGSVATYEGKLGSTNDPRFIHLNSALWSDGAAIHVAKGAVVEAPIQVVFISTTESSAFAVHPRIWVRLEQAAQAKLVETYVGTDGTYFTNAVTEVSLDRDAMLEHIRVQHESANAFHIAHVWAFQEAQSTYTSTSVQFGAKVGRIDVNVWLNGEHTETWLNGTYVGKGEQILDNKTRIDHAMPNCHSFEAYKGILSNKAQGVFNGKIFVYEDAQKTDAKQTNQALLLSPTATINTKPQLEIFADDVKCTHGATIGQLRADQLFYLKSRGIPANEARNMLVYAFSAEVLEKISIDELREYLEAELFAKLND